MPISNASLLDEDFSAIDDWTNGDQAPATSTQETFDGQETLYQNTHESAVGNDYAYLYRTIGSIEGLGNTIAVSIKLYHDLIGTIANTDNFVFNCFRSDWKFSVVFASDGLFISDGATYNEVGTNIVSQDAWQEWTFIFDFSGGVANATCDVYLKIAGIYVLQASDVDCSNIGDFSGLDGYLELECFGYATDNLITYVDYLKIGDDVLDISSIQINIGDVWKTVTGMQINIGDIWKTVTGIQINIGDVWKTIF